MKFILKICFGLVLASSTVSAEVTCGLENTAITPSTATADFILHSDGTATHRATGLMWMRCSLGQEWSGEQCVGIAGKYTWQEALANDSDFAGYTDWRLPNKNELASIVEHRCWNPSVNNEIFPFARPSDYWTSTPVTTNQGMAWAIQFSGGDVQIEYKTSTEYVRLVRSPQ